MQFPPTNFLDIRMGSQFKSLDKNVLNVVPSVSGNNPILNSEINLFAYDSSSAVHFPLLRPAFLVFDIESLTLLLSDKDDEIIPSAKAASCAAASRLIELVDDVIVDDILLSQCHWIHNSEIGFYS